MKCIKTLKIMALMAAIASVFAACNQVTNGDPVEEGLDDPAASLVNLKDGLGGVNLQEQVIKVAPYIWTSLPAPPFTGVSGVTTINGIASNGSNFVAIAGDGKTGYESESIDGGNIWANPAGLPGFTRNPSVANYLNGNYLVTAGNTLTAGAFSTNGVSWTATGTIGFGTKASAYGTGEALYVVGGQNGQAAYTKVLGSSFVPIPSGSSGTGWTGTGPTAYINAGAYGNGTYVFGGGSGRIAYTTAILTGSGAIVPWQTATEPFGSDEFINVIVYGNGTFVAVGGPDPDPAKTTKAKAAYSTDGITWTGLSFPAGFGDNVAVYALAYGGGYFVAGDDAGNIAYLSGGLWTPVKVFSTGTPINALAYGNGRFIAVGGTSAPMASYALCP